MLTTIIFKKILITLITIFLINNIPMKFKTNEINQGNIINNNILKKIKINMTKNNIFNILDKPILRKIFNKNEYILINYDIKNKKIFIKKKIKLIFNKKNLLIKIIKF